MNFNPLILKKNLNYDILATFTPQAIGGIKIFLNLSFFKVLNTTNLFLWVNQNIIIK